MQFQAELEMASPGDIVEAPDFFIKKWNPKGLGPAGFFDYKGARVCPVGKTEDVERFLDRNQEEVMHQNSGHKTNG
jgi:hypothetical protein